MSYLTVLRMEFWKLRRRTRSYLGPAGLLALVLPIAAGMKYGPVAGEFGRMGGAATGMQVIGSPVNALFLARMVLPPTVFFFLPLFVSLVAGDEISGEAADGTLRSLLSRPVGRLSLLMAKYIVALTYAVLLTAFLGVAALAVGWALFGVGSLVTFDDGVVFFGMREGLWRLALSYALVAAAMLSVAGVAFLVSTLVSNSLAPVGATMALIFILLALEEIPYFSGMKPWLFTGHLEVARKAFAIPLDVAAMGRALAVFAAWCAGTFVLSAVVFTRKDILS